MNTIRPAGVVCPGCGSEWELTEEERAESSFRCDDCGTVMRQGDVDVRLHQRRRFDWHGFLPRSESKWVFVLVMAAYNYVLQGIFLAVMSPFVGPYTGYRPRGWTEAVLHLASSLVFSPVWQTLALVALMELCRAIRFPVAVQILIPAILVSSTDGLRWWPHAVYSFAGFFVFAVSYLYWRATSWRVAAAIAIAIHATFNGIVDLRLVFGTIESEQVSRRLTGDASSWERADAIYRGHWSLDSTAGREDEIQSLQSAIAIYPYDPNYYLSLGLAYRSMGRLAEAEATLRKAVALNDEENTWKAKYDLSFVLADEKRFREALDNAHEALLSAPVASRSEIEAQIAAITPKANGASQ